MYEKITKEKGRKRRHLPYHVAGTDCGGHVAKFSKIGQDGGGKSAAENSHRWYNNRPKLNNSFSKMSTKFALKK